MHLEFWGPGDLALLQRLNGDPARMEHLGGPATPEGIAERQRRYEGDPAQRKIVDGDEGVGWVGYWEREWRGGQVYEVGWAVLPEAQGRGLASAATALVIEAARAEGRCRYGHAFPSADNPASNAICAKLGFTLLEAREVRVPAGPLHALQRLAAGPRRRLTTGP